MKHRSSTWVFVTLLVLAFLQTSCERRQKPSILIVAVDSLPFNLSLCSREGDEGRSGFSTLCKESIRFTHAMTPSTLSVPALASIMTGLYPHDHGLRHNGSTGLSPRITTFGEAALNQGYRTAFFSGGAPIWRRTGLHQGFEVFDDLVNFSTGKLFRPLDESVQLFREWSLEEVGDEAFAALLYAPDLNFTDTVTETLSGELRGLSYDSQLEEMEESLEDLFQFLKKRNRWDDTMLILVGLNGREVSPRDGEIEPTNLHSENTQVSLFIKPAQKPRDEAIRWTVDRNVSLADLGRTLLDFAGAAPPAAEADKDFPVVSLIAELKNSQPSWPEDRPVLMESSWTSWQGLSGARGAVLKSQELTIFDFPPLVYNTLTDRFEILPLASEQADPALLSSLRRKSFRPWTPLHPSLQKSFSISPLNWLSANRAAILHRELISLSKEKLAHPRLLRWAAQSSLEQKDWASLRSLGQRMNRPDWLAVADRNQNKKADFKDVCLSLLSKKKVRNEDVKQCPDEVFLAFYSWHQARRTKGQEREFLKRRFQKAWEGAQLDLRILKANAALGLIWLPLSAEENIPSRTSLALALPEAREK